MPLESDSFETERPRAPVRRSRPLVLIIDGHEKRVSLYSIALSSAGFDVAPVSDAEQAYSRALDLSPNIVVTEWPVPKGNGWAFLRNLRQDPRTRDVLMVVVTDQTHELNHESNQEWEGVLFLPKPGSPHALVIGLRRLLARQQP